MTSLDEYKNWMNQSELSKNDFLNWWLIDSDYDSPVSKVKGSLIVLKN